MSLKLFDSELKVMDILWKEGEMPASRIAAVLGRQVGWNKNTTYTVVKKCVEKGVIERREPNFVCRALVTREAAQAWEVDELIDRMFDGSAELLFASLLGSKKVPAAVIERLRRMIGETE